MAARDTTDVSTETRTLDFGHTTVELVRDADAEDGWTVREDADTTTETVKEFDFGCTRVRMVRDADAEGGWVQEDIPVTPASERVHAAY